MARRSYLILSPSRLPENARIPCTFNNRRLNLGYTIGYRGSHRRSTSEGTAIIMESFLRTWRQDAMNKHQYESAIYIGDKLLALTGRVEYQSVAAVLMVVSTRQ